MDVDNMQRDSRYDILFEPVRIGPLTARNRFYQVPHCTGAGRNHPNTAAEIRAVNAEGGWAVVSTEQCDIHYSADMRSQTRLWTEADIPPAAWDALVSLPYSVEDPEAERDYKPG